jgi:hypothetical protein
MHWQRMSENTANGTLRRLSYGKTDIIGHGFINITSTHLHELGWKSFVREPVCHKDSTIPWVYNYAEYLDDVMKGCSLVQIILMG